MNRRHLWGHGPVTLAGQARRAAREVEYLATCAESAAVNVDTPAAWEEAARLWHKAAGLWLAARHSAGGRESDRDCADGCLLAGAEALADADRLARVNPSGSLAVRA